MYYAQLFTTETEVQLHLDLTNKAENITIHDTMYLVDLILNNRNIKQLPWHTRTNLVLLLKKVYEHMYNICDWDTVAVTTGHIPFIKQTLKRMKGIIDSTYILPSWTLYLFLLFTRKL